MLRPSRKALFAIEAVVDIAYHAGAGPVRSTAISERQGIPRRYLEQVLQQLVHSGILSGQRGPRGGYRLARERRRISVGEIVRVVRSVEGAGDPANSEQGSEIGIKVVRPVLQEIQQEVMGKLDRLTIEELCDRARAANVPCDTPAMPDFSI